MPGRHPADLRVQPGRRRAAARRLREARPGGRDPQRLGAVERLPRDLRRRAAAAGEEHHPARRVRRRRRDGQPAPDRRVRAGRMPDAPPRGLHLEPVDRLGRVRQVRRPAKPHAPRAEAGALRRLLRLQVGGGDGRVPPVLPREGLLRLGGLGALERLRALPLQDERAAEPRAAPRPEVGCGARDAGVQPRPGALRGPWPRGPPPLAPRGRPAAGGARRLRLRVLRPRLGARRRRRLVAPHRARGALQRRRRGGVARGRRRPDRGASRRLPACGHGGGGRGLRLLAPRPLAGRT
mmetsp:Transcript_44346/g.96850  ORF Transcript_44346/g.96850 Transcript_44346/m.96850 type:complete len:294 (-) Transcript_44346:40-921(-)